jgi:hypothetical protein
MQAGPRNSHVGTPYFPRWEGRRYTWNLSRETKRLQKLLGGWSFPLLRNRHLLIKFVTLFKHQGIAERRTYGKEALQREQAESCTIRSTDQKEQLGLH